MSGVSCASLKMKYCHTDMSNKEVCQFPLNKIVSLSKWQMLNLSLSAAAIQPMGSLSLTFHHKSWQELDEKWIIAIKSALHHSIELQ